MRIHSAATLVAIALVPAGLTADPEDTAVADLALLDCLSVRQQTYQPGLTLTPRTTTITAVAEHACTPNAHGITSGTSFLVSTVEASCLLASPITTTVQTITWNDGRTSTLEQTNVVTRTLGQTIVVSNGTVVAGLFTGSTAQTQIVYLNPALLACLSPTGVLEVVGPGNLLIL